MHSSSRTLKLLAMLSLASGLLAAQPAARAAQADWPARPVHLVVPFAPGGSNDVIARQLAQALTGKLGQTVVVENRAGAGGVIGANAVASSTPDGYTFLFTSGSIATSAAVQKTPYDVTKAFAGVSRVATAPFVIITRHDLPARTVPELVALAKSKPGELNYGSAGLGDSTQMATELFKKAAGIEIQQVGYNGIAPAQLDLQAGRLDLIITTVAAIRGSASDELPKLAFTTAQRDPAYPDIPTVREAGLDYTVEVWWGVFAPAGTDAAIVKRLNQAIGEVVAEPKFAEFLRQSGAQATPSSPEAMQASLLHDAALWARTAKELGIQP